MSRYPAPVTFTTSNWDIPQIITLTAVDNSSADGNSTVNITHTVGSNYATTITPTVIVTVVDDEDIFPYDFTKNGSVTVKTMGSYFTC